MTEFQDNSNPWTRLAGAGPYLLIGLGLFAAAEAVLHSRVGGGEIGGLLVAWSYSQLKVLGLLPRFVSTAVPLAVLWALAYCAIALGLWYVVERVPRKRPGSSARRALVAWSVTITVYCLLVFLFARAGFLAD